jgi:hypothetical protein
MPSGIGCVELHVLQDRAGVLDKAIRVHPPHLNKPEEQGAVDIPYRERAVRVLVRQEQEGEIVAAHFSNWLSQPNVSLENHS